MTSGFWEKWVAVCTQHGALLVVCGSILILALFTVYQYKGILVRRRFLARREHMDESSWFDEFFPVDSEKREIARALLNAFAAEIGVHWTQLRPTDTFEDTLRVPKKYSPIDDLENAEDFVVSIARQFDLPAKELPGFQGSLGKFLTDFLSLQELTGRKAANGGRQIGTGGWLASSGMGQRS